MKAKYSFSPILASSLECPLKVFCAKCRSKTNKLGLIPYFIIILNLFILTYFGPCFVHLAPVCAFVLQLESC